MLKDKKILFLVHSYNSFTKDQIEALSHHCDEVYVLVRYKPLAELSRFFKFLSSFKNHQKRFAIDLIKKPHNVKIYPISINYFPGDFFYKFIGNRLYRKCLTLIRKKNLQFDLIHAHFAWTSGFVAMKLSETFQIPFLITLHGEDIYDLPFRDKIWKKKISEIVSKAERLICVGQKNVNALNQLGIEKNITLIGNGFRNDLFFPLEKEKALSHIHYNLDFPIVLSIGSFDKIKGHRYLMEAFNLLKLKSIKFKGIFIGAGGEEESLHKMINKFGLQDQVQIIGNISHNKLIDYYNASTVLCLPSLHESFGVVQIEAWACGIPVVATRNGGSEYLFNDTDEVGFLVDIENSDQLAEKVSLALNKKWDRERILKFSKKFTLEKTVKEILELYEIVMSQRKQ